MSKDDLYFQHCEQMGIDCEYIHDDYRAALPDQSGTWMSATSSCPSGSQTPTQSRQSNAKGQQQEG
eukprot:1040377-Amphidinium_carterae.1